MRPLFFVRGRVCVHKKAHPAEWEKAQKLNPTSVDKLHLLCYIIIILVRLTNSLFIERKMKK